MIANRSLPRFGDGVGYYFYETTKGFYFQSWENMCAQFARSERTPIQKFFYMPRNITDDKIEEDKVIHDLRSVESYKFINTFHDTAAAQALGTYGHRVITHNLYAKDFKQTDYNYHEQFNNTIHADFTNDIGKDGVEPTIRGNPVDFDNFNVSDYAESMVSLLPTTQFLHSADGTDDTGGFGTNVADDGKFEGIRNAQRMQVDIGTTIQMTIRGQTYIQPGQVIDFHIRPVEPEGETLDKKAYDPQYSGRYIVSKVRHRVTKQEYKMVLEVKKDSVREPHTGESIKTFTGTANNENTKFTSLNDYNSGGK